MAQQDSCKRIVRGATPFSTKSYFIFFDRGVHYERQFIDDPAPSRDLDGLRMHFVEAGKGPAVVLLHGFPETWYAWRYQIAPLAQHYRLIVPDLRGYGATDKPASGYDNARWPTTFEG